MEIHSIAADHGLLLGLGDDDHTQYLFTDGGRDLAGDWDPDIGSTHRLGPNRSFLSIATDSLSCPLIGSSSEVAIAPTGSGERIRFSLVADVPAIGTPVASGINLIIASDGGNVTISGVVLAGNNVTTTGTAFLGLIDLGTNTIDDGVMVGDWNFGSGNLTTTGTFASHDQTITGDGTNSALTINQGGDSKGLEINGFDDQSGANIKMHISSTGKGIIEASDPWEIKSASTLIMSLSNSSVSYLLPAVYFANLTMRDDKNIFFGSTPQFSLDLNSGTGDLTLRSIGGADVDILTVDLAGDFDFKAGNLTTTGTVTADGLILPKTSGKGIKVDTATPTFGFADLLGDQFAKNTGATKPTLTAYNGVVNAWQFANGDEAFLSYHIPHDYVLGTDIHLHVHWSQNAAGATGGTIDFRYSAIYSKGHNQASGSTFTSTPITATFSSIDINDGGSGLNQYQQHFTEVTISAATATAALFDRDDFEPDGVIELTLEMDADNLTGTASSPFIHYVDIHYQTNSVIGTKNRTPDFYG